MLLKGRTKMNKHILFFFLVFSLFSVCAWAEGQEEYPNWFSSCPDSTQMIRVEVPNTLMRDGKEIKLSDWSKRVKSHVTLPIRVVSLDSTSIALFNEDKFEVRVGGKWYNIQQRSWYKDVQVSKQWSDGSIAIQVFVLMEDIRLKDIQSMRLTMGKDVYVLTQESPLK